MSTHKRNGHTGLTTVMHALGTSSHPTCETIVESTREIRGGPGLEISMDGAFRVHYEGVGRGRCHF
jgi:hypothetical protein